MTAADAVVLLHFGFIVFVAAGGLLVLRFPRVAWLHIPATVWGAAVQLGDWVCPLTYLENALRGDLSGSRFIETTLMPLIYPDLLQDGLLTPTVRVALGVALLVLNAVIYTFAVLRWRRALSGEREGLAPRK